MARPVPDTRWGALYPTETSSAFFDATNDALVQDLDRGYQGVSVQISGTWAGQLEFEVTTDGDTWVSHDLIYAATDQIVNATVGNGLFFGTVGTFTAFRVRASSIASGIAVLTLRASIYAESVHVESGTVKISSSPASGSPVAVDSSDTVVDLAAANTARSHLFIFNDSTAILYVKFGADAATDDFTVKMLAGAFYELPVPPVYTGLVTGVWASANGFAYVTELELV